jgi:hypothetical protein
MERQLYQLLFGSPVFEDWHWFRYHFEKKLRGDPEPFAEAIVEACLDCESAMPGYASRTLRVLGSISGREKDERDYDQLLQLLAEVLIVRQLVTSSWGHAARFEFDASPADGKTNVELTIQTARRTIGIEVKAPALLQHQRVRRTRKVQAVSRGVPLGQVHALAGEPSELTLPRDNPVKDFLMSAESKFAEFKREQPGFVGALVIVWDDFIYEPSPPSFIRVQAS